MKEAKAVQIVLAQFLRAGIAADNWRTRLCCIACDGLAKMSRVEKTNFGFGSWSLRFLWHFLTVHTNSCLILNSFTEDDARPTRTFAKTLSVLTFFQGLRWAKQSGKQIKASATR